MEKKIQVYTSDLKIGMYVADLDRPWVDTPFLFQGFSLTGVEEINDLSQFCEYVFVDVELSTKGLMEHLLSYRFTVASKKKSKKRPPKRKNSVQFSEKEFRQALMDSFRVYKDARGWIDTMLDDCRLGKSVDTTKARELVVRLADEVITNPDALVWLTHLRSRDEYTATHCMNVCILALTFGRALDLDDKQLHKLGMGALLHDIGKMRVPDEILNKPGRFTEKEFDIIKMHPSIGHTMLMNDNELDMESLHIVLHHHERLDGGGYPSGMSELEIPLLTRIASIVDVYDAITSDRCYHDGVAPAQALENLFAWAKGNFDVSLLEKFIKCLGIYPIGTVVRLNTQDVGLVVATDVGHRIKPIVLLTTSADGKPYLPRRLLNLSSAVWEETDSPVSIVGVLEPGSLGIELKTILQEELNYSLNTVSSIANC
ncbi:MAG: HD-GYP domain-containing protein [Ectothiorhodospiraceae bacterium]|nr:HD-GYP domain-containing protein [Ectothiorhodospiraceae bacterium]